MIPKPEFGHLYKFVVSAGLILMGAAIALPWFVLQATESLRLRESELEELTEVSGQALLQREQQIAWLVAWYPLLSVVLAVLGVAAIVYGMIKWTSRQQVLDERENIQLAIERQNIVRLTQDEIASAQDREAEEEEAARTAQEDEQLEGTTPSTDVGQASEESGSLSGHSMPRLDVEAPARQTQGPSTFRSEIAFIEGAAIERISRAFARTHSAEPHVRLGDQVADLLLLGKDAVTPTIVVEVVIARSPQTIRMRLAERLLRLARLVQSAQLIRPNHVQGVMVAVSSEPLDGKRVASLHRDWRGSTALLDARLSLIVISAEELNQHDSDSFRHLVLNAFTGG